jgi:hypothetical protein
VTGSEAVPGLGPESRPTRLVPDRLIGIVGGVIFALGALSLGMLVSEPCTTDFMCPAMGLVFFGPPLVVYLVALVIWFAARRVMPLLVLSVAFGLFGLSMASGGYVTPVVAPILGFPFLAPVIVIGSVEVLRVRRIERWVSVVGLGALAVGLLLLRSPEGAIVTGLIAAAVAVLTRARTDPPNDRAG